MKCPTHLAFSVASNHLREKQVCDKVLALPRVGEITVNLVFTPPWDRSKMSEAALLALGL